MTPRRAKSGSGSMVNVVGPPVVVTVWSPVVAHATPMAPTPRFTGSLKVTVGERSGDTLTAPSAGTLDVTTGAGSPAVPHTASGVAEFLGAGAAGSKSARLSSVSTHRSTRTAAECVRQRLGGGALGEVGRAVPDQVDDQGLLIRCARLAGAAVARDAGARAGDDDLARRCRTC